MDRKLKAGLVGLGGVAQEHMRGYALSDRVEITAGADIDETRANDAAGRYNFTPYLDYQEMIDNEALDIICVLTPPALHRPVVEAAAAAGIHILCEKPLAPSMDDAEAMRRVLDQADVCFLFGASYRHLPAMQRARSMIAEGAIGKPRLLIETLIGGRGADKAKTLSDIHYPVGGPGGTPMGLVDHGIHMIDAFPWLTGSPVVSAVGFGNIAGREPVPEAATLQMANGAIGQLIYDEGTVSLSAPTEGVFTEGAGWNVNGFTPAGGWDAHPCVLHIYGDAAALRIYPYANVLYHATPQALHNVSLPALPVPNHFRAQIDTLAASINDGAALAASLDDGVQSLKALLAIYESADEKRVITL